MKFNILRFFFIVLGLFILVELGVTLYTYLKTQQLSLNTNQIIQPDKIIAKVGEELIYQKDLNTELQYYPDKKSESNKILLDKIIRDSVVLQGAKDDGLIKLDSTVYNSLNKNYLQRVKLVDDVRAKVENKANSVSGTLISVWFFNTSPGEAGYERGRQIAYEKINSLNSRVKNKSMTIQQAGENIKTDNTLAQVDPAYKANAIVNFKGYKNQDITFDKDFDNVLWGLKIGEVSDIKLIKDVDPKTGKKIDAAYFFAQIADKNTDTAIANYDEWFASKFKKYDKIYY